MGKTKFFVIPCLVLSILLGALSVRKTLALFTDRTQYTIMVYPYDGRGETNLTFSDGSTVKGFSDGDTATMTYSFTNTSAAAVTSLSVTVTLPGGSTHSYSASNIASGETRTIPISETLTAAMLDTHDTTVGSETATNIYNEISVTATPLGFQMTGGTAHSVTVSPKVSRVYVFREEVSP